MLFQLLLYFLFLFCNHLRLFLPILIIMLFVNFCKLLFCHLFNFIRVHIIMRNRIRIVWSITICWVITILLSFFSSFFVFFFCNFLFFNVLFYIFFFICLGKSFRLWNVYLLRFIFNFNNFLPTFPASCIFIFILFQFF